MSAGGADGQQVETPDKLIQQGHRSWERVLLGDNSVQGTFRLLLYIILFALVFGSVFHFGG
jgi:hypothetical protein